LTETFEVNVSPSRLGIRFGDLSGNLRNGLKVQMDMSMANGETSFNLKNEYGVWIALGLIDRESAQKVHRNLIV
jgi:hypothetical protein